MISATATPSQVRLRTFAPDIVSERRAPAHRTTMAFAGIYSSEEFPGTEKRRRRVGGRGSTTPARHSHGGASLLPTVRRNQSINGLLYARERIREFGMRKRARAIQGKRETGKRLGRAGRPSSGGL